MMGILEAPYRATKNRPTGAAVARPFNLRIWPSCLCILTAAWCYCLKHERSAVFFTPGMHKLYKRKHKREEQMGG